MRIFFIGVGKMGLPMALHLAGAGHAVTVTDLLADARGLAATHGLTVCPASDEDIFAAMAQAEVIFSSLPNDQALLSVAQQIGQLAGQTANAGKVYIDTSTVSVAASAQAAKLCASADVPYLRATVSGNNKMAQAAQLTVLVSGPRAAYEQVMPLLQCLGPNRFYLGDAEQARLMKLVINLMIAQTSAMLAEGLTLGRKGGLDWQTMWQVLCASAVASPILKAKAVQLSERDFSPTFTVPQMIKDLDLILQAGSDHGVSLPQTTLTHALMQTAVAQGLGDEDYAAIIKTVERSAALS
jgi:3-hydroxyisobutyrate dehydrogenase-like beta-hydroxyacid dehydrogenase